MLLIQVSLTALMVATLSELCLILVDESSADSITANITSDEKDGEFRCRK